MVRGRLHGPNGPPRYHLAAEDEGVRRDRSGRWLIAVAVAALGAGCGEDANPPDYVIGASAEWSWSAATPSALGYTTAVLMEQQPPRIGAATCRTAPHSARLTVNGADVPLTVPDPSTGCLEGKFLSPPALGPTTVTARIEEEGQLVGEVTFDNLTPGTAATLVSPADGQVHADDQIVIAPPAALPTDALGRVAFYPLDASNWLPEGITIFPDQSERGLDGIHVDVPAFSGPAALILDGYPPYLWPDVTCPGFARCTEIIAVTLGPLMLTEAP